jgi:hypothetical protein
MKTIIVFLIAFFVFGFSGSLMAQEYQIECVDGTCSKWQKVQDLPEETVTSRISEIDAEILFLGTVPDMARPMAIAISDMIEYARVNGVSFVEAKEARINALTEEKKALESRETDSR